jgi:cholesterol transport system auxiliary component
MSGKSLLASIIALVLAACSIGKPVPQPTTYVVEPTAPSERLARTHGSEVVRMGGVRVAAAFSGNALVYRTDDVTFISDPYQAFIADPPAMFGNQMASWLNRAGPFKAVMQPDSALPANYTLEATVTELYGDFRPGKPAAAVMAVQFTLVNVDAVGSGLVFERTISRRVPLERATPDALVRGYGQAVSEILSELAGDLAARKLK